MNQTQLGSEVRKSITRNMSVMMGAQVITWVTSFVLLYFLPRYLGSEDFGRLYLALSIKMMLGLMIDFGGNYLIPKEVARSARRGSKILNSYILLRIGLWMLAMGLILLLSDLLGYSDHVHLLIIILAIGKLWEGGGAAIGSYFLGIERMEYPSLANIFEKVFVAGVAVAALLMGADSTVIAIVISLGALVNLLVLYFYSRDFMKISYKFDKRVFSILSTGMPYFLFSLFSVIYYRVDAIMISAITNDAVTGWYGGAYRFFDIVMVLPLIYKTAIFPIFSKLWNDKQGVLESTVGESLRFMVILGFPTMVLIAFYASPIIHFFMGLEEYGPSVLILQIFALSIPIIFIDIILGSAIMGAANRQNAWAVIGFLAIFINVGANLLLIPYTQTTFMNGGIGAAVATLITELFVMVSAIYLLPAGYLRSFRLSYLTKPALATVVMLIPMVLLQLIGLYWMISMALSGLIFLGLLFALGSFTRNEIEMIKGAISWQELKLTFSKP